MQAMKKMIRLENKSQRNRTIDIARGIGIISIIIGHFGIYPIVRVVFTYHVPMFYIISGYLIKREKYCSFLKRKIRSLFIPYVITCLIVTVLQGIKAFLCGIDIYGTLWYWLRAGFYGAGGIVQNLPASFPAIGAVWFLLAIFWGSLLTQLILRCSPHLQIPVVVILFLLGYISAHKLIWLPFDIQPGCCAVLYMYVGYLVNHFENRIERSRKRIWPAAFLAWMLFIYNFTSFYIVSCDYGRGLVDIASSFCACYCIYFFAERLSRFDSKAVDTLAYFGRYSLIVLCVHLVEMDLVDWRAVVDRLQRVGASRLFGCFLAVVIKMMLIIGWTVLIVRLKEKTVKASDRSHL